MGETGLGAKPPADSIARMSFPGCHYTLPSGDTPTEGDPGPSDLVCAGVTVYSPDGQAADFDHVAKLFKIRLVGQEDPEAYIGGSGLPGGGGNYTGPFPDLPAATPEIFKRIIAYAKAQLGEPYIWGGVGPYGFDCSGLMMMAYRAGGVPISRTTFTQVHEGRGVSLSDVAPGDLLFTPGSDGTVANPGHVGMYIGGGILIQAPHTGDVVKLTPLSEWASDIVAVRRIIG
jgi:hypothetical protein